MFVLELAPPLTRLIWTCFRSQSHQGLPLPSSGRSQCIGKIVLPPKNGAISDVLILESFCIFQKLDSYPGPPWWILAVRPSSMVRKCCTNLLQVLPNMPGYSFGTERTHRACARHNLIEITFVVVKNFEMDGSDLIDSPRIQCYEVEAAIVANNFVFSDVRRQLPTQPKCTDQVIGGFVAFGSFCSLQRQVGLFTNRRTRGIWRRSWCRGGLGGDGHDQSTMEEVNRWTGQRVGAIGFYQICVLAASVVGLLERSVYIRA